MNINDILSDFQEKAQSIEDLLARQIIYDKNQLKVHLENQISNLERFMQEQLISDKEATDTLNRLRLLHQKIGGITAPKSLRIRTAKYSPYLIVKQSDIVCVDVKGSYCRIFFYDDGKLLVSELILKRLKHYKDLLDPTIFLRTHRNHLLNTNYIKYQYNGTILLKAQYKGIDLKRPLSKKYTRDFNKRFH